MRPISCWYKQLANSFNEFDNRCLPYNLALVKLVPYEKRINRKSLVKINRSVDAKLINSSDSMNSDIFSKVGRVLGGYQPGFEIVKGIDPEAIEHFTVISAKGVPRLLLPPSRSLMRTAMTSFLGGRYVANLLPSCVQLAAKMGGPLSRFSSSVSLMSQTGAPSPLRQLIADVVGRNDFKIALRVSFGRPNAKTVAMAISDTGEVLCYVKLGSEAMTGDLIAHESKMLEQFENIDMPVIMPPRLYSGTWADGQNALITGALKLEPLSRDAHMAHAAADALASQTMVTRSPLVSSAYWHRIVEFADQHSDSDVLSTTVADIERIWGASDFDFGASHGDWSRANVGMANGQVAAIDWERCTELAPRGIDIAHFAIIETTSRRFSKAINIDQLAETVRQYLKSADLPSANAEAMIVFALLEMVVRFKSAEKAGLKSTDSKFGPALQAGVQKWA